MKINFTNANFNNKINFLANRKTREKIFDSFSKIFKKMYELRRNYLTDLFVLFNKIKMT